MATKDKVVFGISNLHFCTYDVDDNGGVTLGTPYHVPGTVSMSLDAESEENKFYADNVVYFSGYSDNGYSGEIENALFDDTFKTTFLNYVELADGGIAQVKGMQNKAVALMFQIEGDVSSRRGILYNVSLGHISRDHATVEDSITPQTATLPFTVNGDNKTGIIRVGYPEDNAVYNTLFTTPPAPVLPAQSE